jgi:hypothetical protein
MQYAKNKDDNISYANEWLMIKWLRALNYRKIKEEASSNHKTLEKTKISTTKSLL